MTCLRYPNSDPYYPGRVIHLEPSDDAWEMARAWSRRVEVIECDCVATQGVSRGSEGAEMGQMWENGAITEAAPAGASTPVVRGPDPYEGGALTQDSRVSSSVVLDG